MYRYIDSVDIKIPSTGKHAKIGLSGKNLIITGGNGCGKTQLLDIIFNKLKS